MCVCVCVTFTPVNKETGLTVSCLKYKVVPTVCVCVCDYMCVFSLFH